MNSISQLETSTQENFEDKLYKFAEGLDERQQGVIINLMEGLQGDLVGSIKESLKEIGVDDLRTALSLTSDSENAKSPFNAIRSRLFELLIQYDRTLVEMSPVEFELTEALTHPLKYKLYAVSGKRVPDLVSIKLKEGKPVITGFGDAKLGKLDSRALDQVKGVPDTLKVAVTNINSARGNVINSGLTNLATLRNQGEIGIEKKLARTIYVPADTELTPEGLIKAEDFPDRPTKAVFQQFRNLGVEFKQAAFTQTEITDIAKIVFQQLLNEEQ